VTFAHPALLALTLLVLIAIVLGARTLARRRAADVLAYSNLDFLAAATRSRIPWSTLLAGIWIAALGGLAVALAGPRVIAPVIVHDGAVALCIDTSGSMASTDIAPTRAGAAVAAGHAFVDALPSGTRIALLAFASNAVVVFGPSDDRDAAREAFDRIPAPNGGTAIGDCLILAARTLPPGGHRAIVLVTDGVNNSGVDPVAAAQQMGAANITIDTVGIGTAKSGLLIPGTTEEADLDEDALRAIAAAAHGAYARASDANALRAHLAALARATSFERRRVDAALPIALGSGLLLAAAGALAFALGRFP
jgi:Ca-activated chloride channel homolog